jgi:hypothetical protein
MDSEAVSAKLQFVRKESLDEAEVLYSEAIPGGFNVISKAPSEPSAIDMELLFNAVTSGKQIL